MLDIRWDDNTEAMVKEAIRSGSLVSLDIRGSATPVITSYAVTIRKLKSAWDLRSKYVSKNHEIQWKNAEVAQHIKYRGDAYDHYVAHITVFNKKYESPLDDVIPIPKGRTPTLLSVPSNLKP